MHKLLRPVAASAPLALLLGNAGIARADDLTVSTAITTPVATATAANNTAGNITVASGGSVTVATGAAATVNSSNNLTNNGTISSTAASNGIGVSVVGPVNTTITNNATISATGTTGNNIGLLVGGGASGSILFGASGQVSASGPNAIGVSLAGPFTGNVTLRSVAVTGATSTAVSVTGALTGNLTLYGSATSIGAGGYGVLVAAPVSGSVVNGGTIVSGANATNDSTGKAVAGVIGVAGVRISSNVGAGFVNDRFYIDANGNIVPPAQVNTATNTLVTGTITSQGNAPALLIAADATNPQAITLGAFGTGADGYAVINRGGIAQNAGNAKMAVVAVQFGGVGAATTTLAGGFNNQSTGTINSVAIDAQSTAMLVGAGAVVPSFVNGGNLTAAVSQTAASGTTPAGTGGAAYGVYVDTGGNLGSIVNTGTLNAASIGAGKGAYAILDKSGTLTSITNSGTIAAATGDKTADVRAIDLTSSAASVAVTNSGTISGDIVFGSGASSLTTTAGTINGAVRFGAGGGLLAMSGTGAISGAVTSVGGLDVTLAGSALLNLAGGTSTLASIAAMGNSVLVLPISGSATALTVTGAATFTGASRVRLSLQSLAPNQTITLIQANGGFSTDHLATLVDATSSPFLFTAGPAVATDTALSITLTRKTASQLGFATGIAPLFDQSIAGLAGDTAASQAIANLTTGAAVLGAYNQILPPSFTRAPLQLAQSLADGGFGATAERLAVLRAQSSDGVAAQGAWLQEYGDRMTQKAGANERDYRGWSFGVAGGWDWAIGKQLVAGIGLSTQFATLHLNNGAGVNDTPLSADSYALEGHLAWAQKAFFVQANAMVGRVSYRSSRNLVIGSLAETVNANWHGLVYAAGVTGGANFDIGRLRITPQDTLSYVRLQQNGYTETGGGGFNLAVDSYARAVPTNTAKLSVSYGVPVGEADLRLEVHGAYVSQFSTDPARTTAHYVGGGNPFVLTGDAIGSGQTGYGAGLHYNQGGFRVAATYDRRSGSGFVDQAGMLTVGFVF